MKRTIVILLAAVAAIMPASAAMKAIRFGKLWDGHKVIANALVVVDGDKVQSVTENGKPPKGAELIDLRQYTGLPGFIDSHTHVTYYWGGDPGTTPLRQPQRHVAATVFLSQANAKKTLESGTTTIRDLNAAGGADLAMRDLINMGAMVGPRMFVSSGGLRSYKGRPGVTDPLAEAAKQTKAVIDAGADWVKVFGSQGGFNNVTMDQTVSFEEMKTIVDTAHGLGHKSPSTLMDRTGREMRFAPGQIRWNMRQIWTMPRLRNWCGRRFSTCRRLTITSTTLRMRTMFTSSRRRRRAICGITSTAITPRRRRCLRQEAAGTW